MEKNEYPLTRRRLRTGSHIRELSASVRLSHRQFIQPLFVEEGLGTSRAVEGLNGVEVHTLNSLLQKVEENLQNGISKFLLFPVPARKQERPVDFSFAASAFKAIREQFGPDVWVAADCCLCSYTPHGHCGILNEAQTQLRNSATVDSLCRYAAALADAGADCIAPSDMTDGRIRAIRTTLDALGFETVSILSYSAKFSSQFYGPFRDACRSTPAAGGLQNRKTYQLSPMNGNDALACSLRDEQEGADMLMVKPAALYTDVIARLKQQTLLPVAAYHVSGEYAALEELVQKGWVNREAAHLEVWTALARAGADILISYAAKQAREWIEKLEY